MRLSRHNSKVETVPWDGRMSIYRDPHDEQNLCAVLKAFVEEWGQERITVSIPRSWSYFKNRSLGKVRLEFIDENCVSIRVDYDYGRVVYSVILAA
jgi:hypothetical protein